ncbi:hypothetical protein AZE42_10963, partial [Rhizopogon vesiculosus]
MTSTFQAEATPLLLNNTHGLLGGFFTDTTDSSESCHVSAPSSTLHPYTLISRLSSLFHRSQPNNRQETALQQKFTIEMGSESRVATNAFNSLSDRSSSSNPTAYLHTPARARSPSNYEVEEKKGEEDNLWPI